MITIYKYAFTMLRDCIVILFELLTHILNINNESIKKETSYFNMSG